MQTLSRQVLSSVDADAESTSDIINATYLSSMSAQVVVSGGTSIEGTLYADVSDDPVVLANSVINWSALSGGSVDVSGNGVSLLGPVAICSRWLRFRWVPASGSGGALTASVMAQSGPSPVTLPESSAVPLAAARVDSALVANLWAIPDGVSSYSNGTVAAGVIRGMPFVPGRDCTIIALGVVCASGVANSVIRVGVYDVGASGYPDALLGESEELSTSSTGLKSSTVSIPLTKGNPYFIATLAGVANPNVARANVVGTGMVYATAAGTSAQSVAGLGVSQAYGPFPATFPAGAVASASAGNFALPLFQLETP
jgi:hypothetical protein